MPPSPADPIRIERVGADGDGVGTFEGRPLYLPFALPGEFARPDGLVRRGQGRAASSAEIVAPSPDRVAPPCPHFGACGGCALQHWADAPYAEWKRREVADALARAGFAGAPALSARTPPGARRRIELAVRREGVAIRLGLHGRRDSAIVDIGPCPVLHPRLLGLLDPLRETLRRLGALRREGSVAANLLDSGPDLLLRTDGPLDAAGRALLAEFARRHRIPRVAWARGDAAPETAAQTGPATIGFDGAEVAPPPGAFLQASAEGETAIRAAVLAGLPARLRGRAPIVELYAGCGSFTFALAARARVVAVEGDPGAAAALRRAAAGRPITVLQRDLARQPMQPAELAGAAAVVLDPPYGGAAAQIGPIAAAGVKRVIYVSCNPAALARDASVLAAAGYRLLAAEAIDQFLWSARVEAVAVFGRVL